jgi:hypothetical protein
MSYSFSFHPLYPIVYKIYFSSQGNCTANGYALMIDHNSENYYSPLEVQAMLGLTEDQKREIMQYGEQLIIDNSK